MIEGETEERRGGGRPRHPFRGYPGPHRGRRDGPGGVGRDAVAMTTGSGVREAKHRGARQWH